MVSDKSLVEAMSKGDQAAFEAFVHRYHAPLLSYLTRMLKDPALAEDIVQETFIKFIKQLNKSHVLEKPKPWLYRVASNLCRDHWRSARVRSEKQNFDDLPDQADTATSVIDIYEKQETRKEILAQLDDLSDKQREIVLLRFYQDLKLKEIADILDIPVGSVKSSLFHALKKLKTMFEKRMEDDFHDRGIHRS